MSRYQEGDGEYWGEDKQAMWDHNVRQALAGKRGQKALQDLRDALLALPEKRLIARALCTRGGDRLASFDIDWERDDMQELLGQEGEGVCAVGAYVWWQKVKAGMEPEAAFAALPTYEDLGYDLSSTVEIGKEAGLVGVLAWELAYRNDETYQDYTPEGRYRRFMLWLDQQIAAS